MANTPPTKAGEMHISQSQKYLRVIDADTGDVVQLAMADTGLTTADGLSIFALGVTGVGAPVPTSPIRPNAQTSGALTMNGTLQPLPATTDAMYVWLRAADANTIDILLWNNTPLGPGESIIVETDNDASWIRAQAASGTLNYSILRRV
jgi:hypothetical protein